MDITRNELIFFIASLLAITFAGFVMTTREVDEKKFTYRVDLISEDGLRDATFFTNEQTTYENGVLKIGNTEVKDVRAHISEM